LVLVPSRQWMRMATSLFEKRYKKKSKTFIPENLDLKTEILEVHSKL
jgi:hypothetical protein